MVMVYGFAGAPVMKICSVLLPHAALMLGSVQYIRSSDTPMREKKPFSRASFFVIENANGYEGDVRRCP